MMMSKDVFGLGKAGLATSSAPCRALHTLWVDVVTSSAVFQRSIEQTFVPGMQAGSIHAPGQSHACCYMNAPNLLYDCTPPAASHPTRITSFLQPSMCADRWDKNQSSVVVSIRCI